MESRRLAADRPAEDAGPATGGCIEACGHRSVILAPPRSVSSRRCGAAARRLGGAAARRPGRSAAGRCGGAAAVRRPGGSTVRRRDSAARFRHLLPRRSFVRLFLPSAHPRGRCRFAALEDQLDQARRDKRGLPRTMQRSSNARLATIWHLLTDRPCSALERSGRDARRSGAAVPRPGPSRRAAPRPAGPRPGPSRWAAPRPAVPRPVPLGRAPSRPVPPYRPAPAGPARSARPAR